MRDSQLRAKAICDGRGNAGTGARACVLMLETGEIISQKAERLGPTTNIVAEHLAIQLALEMAIAAGVRRLVVWNDSRSPVNHVLGIYKVRAGHLRPIVDETLKLGRRLESFSIEWVPREKTLLADRLCREVDKRPEAS